MAPLDAADVLNRDWGLTVTIDQLAGPAEDQLSIPPPDPPTAARRTRLLMLLAVAGALVLGLAIGRAGASAARSEAFAAVAERDQASEAARLAAEDRDAIAAELEATQARLSEAESEASQTASNLAKTEAERDEALAAIADAERRAETAEERALKDARSTAREELSARRERLDSLEQRLDKRKQALDRRADALDTAEAQAELTRFGNGVWEVGVDILPGRYKTQGQGDSCYWAKLSSDGTDIIDNHIGEGPQTVVVEAGTLFESSRCGEWARS